MPPAATAATLTAAQALLPAAAATRPAAPPARLQEIVLSAYRANLMAALAAPHSAALAAAATAAAPEPPPLLPTRVASRFRQRVPQWAVPAEEDSAPDKAEEMAARLRRTQRLQAPPAAVVASAF